MVTIYKYIYIRRRCKRGSDKLSLADHKTILFKTCRECAIYVTFIEQKGECIIRYFGRPCDEFAERVWPIKIADGARVTLFNKGLVSCDVKVF